MTQAQPTNPERERLFEQQPGPAQRRIFELSEAGQGIDAIYVRPAEVPDIYKNTSVKTTPTPETPKKDSSANETLLRQAYSLLDEINDESQN